MTLPCPGPILCVRGDRAKHVRPLSFTLTHTILGHVLIPAISEVAREDRLLPVVPPALAVAVGAQAGLAHQRVRVPDEVGVEVDAVGAAGRIPPTRKRIRVRDLLASGLRGREGDVLVPVGGRPDGLGFGAAEVVG